jgi:hypothetical protein
MNTVELGSKESRDRDDRRSRELGRLLRPIVVAVGLAALLLGRLLATLPAVPESVPVSAESSWVEPRDLGADEQSQAYTLSGVVKGA